jgi:hypothetical protein
LLALGVRVFNLGTFSLWLDEILAAVWSHRPLAEVWAISLADKVHPPFSNLLTWALRGLGLGEVGQRLVSVGFGVATVLLLCLWATRQFGRRVGLLVGVLAALAPVHVRYSQELRPYPYALFFVVLSLMALDRLRKRPRWTSAVLATLAVVGGLYTHYFFFIALTAPTWIVVEGLLGADQSRRRDRWLDAAWLVGSLCTAGALFLPWVRTLVEAGARPVGGVASWTWAQVLTRLQFLTVSADEGVAASWAVVPAVAALAVGIAVSSRSRSGRGVLVAGLMGTVGAEALLVWRGHWSNGRYDLMGWPFVVVLLALGVDWLLVRGRWAWVGKAMLGFLFVGEVLGLVQYDQDGRQHWDQVAGAVQALRRPGEPILVENEWTRISLAYYLYGPGFDAMKPEETGISTLGAGLRNLIAGWPTRQEALVLASGFPESWEFRRAAETLPTLARYRLSDGATISLLRRSTMGAGAGDGAGTCASEGRWLPWRLRVPEQGRIGSLLAAFRTPRSGHAGGLRLELDSSDSQFMAFGWSGWERGPDGTTFVWAVGRWAVVSAPVMAPWPQLLAFRAWPVSAPGRQQQLSVCLNGQELGSLPLHSGAQTIVLQTPARAWRVGENVLEFHFGMTAAPADFDSRSDDRRELAVAFDWLELRL